MSKQIDGSPFGAWKLLRNGKWVPLIVLRAHCGAEGDRRARDLRGEEYGGFTVEIEKRGHATYFRIPIAEIKANELAAACLDSRIKVTRLNEVDRIKTLKLPVKDIVLVLALINNDAQLTEPSVKKMWDTRRPKIANRLRLALPVNIQHPYDLFEQDNEDD